MTNNYVDEFKTAMIEAGIFTSEQLIPDGLLHRFYVEGDKAGSKNGAYVLHLDAHPSGYFEHFRTGEKRRWTADGKRQRLSEAVKQQIELARQQRQKETIQRQQKTAKTGNYLFFEKAQKLIFRTNPYLVGKKIDPHGSRSMDWRKKVDDEIIIIRNSLIVPLIDETGLIQNLQAIFPQKPPQLQRNKDFLYGGRLKACFAKIGNYQANRPIRIAEGFATAASVHQCTGDLTLAAMSAANLVEVALIVRQKRPDAEIIIMSDNDLSGKGQEWARKAALAVGGRYLIPPTVGHDWNDHINAGGIA